MSTETPDEVQLWTTVSQKQASAEALNTQMRNQRLEVMNRMQIKRQIMREIMDARIAGTPLPDEQAKLAEAATLQNEVDGLRASIRQKRSTIREKRSVVDSTVQFLRDEALGEAGIPPPDPETFFLKALEVEDIETTGHAKVGELEVARGSHLRGVVQADKSVYVKGNLQVGSSAVPRDLIVNGDFKVNGEVKGNIIPDVGDTYTLGSIDKPFRDLFLGPSSLYINGEKVISAENSGELHIETTANQNLVLETRGTGQLKMQSQGGDIMFATTGNLADVKLVSQRGYVSIDADRGLLISGGAEVNGELLIQTPSGIPNVPISGTTDGLLIGGPGVRIAGNLTVEGTETILNTTVLEVEDNLITLNRGMTAGVAPTGFQSGIIVNRGPGVPDYKFLFEQGPNEFKIGEASDLQPVATREESSAITDGGIAVWEASTSRFVTGRGPKVDASGNVGIGTSDTSSHRLSVDGSCGITGNSFVGGNLGVVGSVGIGNGNYNFGDHSLCVHGSIAATGNIYSNQDIKAFSVTTVSDRRTKTNIQPLTDVMRPLDVIQNMQGVAFTDARGKDSIGFIAQEVQEVLPQVVSQESESEDGRLSLAYGNVTALLVEAIKGLRQEVADLRSRLAKVESQQCVCP